MPSILEIHARRLLTVLVIAAACDHEDDEQGATGACQGAKCDDLEEDDEVLDCGPDSTHIELARRVVGELDGFDRTPDRGGSVTTLGDLNRDGRADLAVMPGISYEGDNETIVLLMTDASRCPRTYVGAFIGIEAQALPTASAGARKDVLVRYTEGCTMLERDLVFDSELEEYEVRRDHLSDECGNLSCRDDADLVDYAREQLTALSPTFFVPEGFVAQTQVTELPDANGDGEPERLVRPGLDYGPTTRQLVLYFSGEPDACADEFAGEFAATAIEVDESRANEGVHDILVIHRAECVGESIRHRYEDGVYVPVETVPLDVDC